MNRRFRMTSRRCGDSWPFLVLTTIFLQTTSGSYVFPEFRFLVEPQDKIVVKNEAAILDCSATSSVGVPPPTIKWKRDGEILEFPDYNDRRRLLSNGSLFFSKVYHTRTNRPDEGLYQCMATVEGLGTIISRTATLKVKAPLRFESEPSDISVFLGQTAVFECAVSATPPFSSRTVAAAAVVWLKDDQPLILDHRMKVMPSGLLEITDVKLSDLASYKCTYGGTSSKSALLKISFDMVAAKVNKAPEFIAKPRNTKAQEGETVTMDCAANGIPQPYVTWLKDGSTVDLNHLDSRFTKIGSGSLKIRDVRVGDEGTYQCRAENSQDSVDKAAILDVEVKPRFVRKPGNQVSYEKGDIQFQCEVFAQPPATVQWYKNGDLIIESDYFQIVRGTNLKILGLVESDAGVYQCVATNSVGNIQAAAQLKVLQKDREKEVLSKVSSSSSSSSSSVPELLNEVVFKNTPTAPLEVNAAIVATRFITLSWSPPSIPNGPIIGYSVFYKQKGSNRERVLNSTRGSLEEINIQGLIPGTEYVMRVVAINEHGSGDSSEPPLIVSTQDEIDVPGSVTDLTCRATSSFSILISWNKPDYQSGFITAYKLYYRQGEYGEEKSVSVKVMQYHLSDLNEYEEYTFWVSASNGNGEGVFSEEISCRTYSDIPSDPPQNVTLEAASSRSMIVRWEPPPKESQNGVITGYKIRWRRRGRGKSEIVTTDGSRRLYAITDLRVGTEYQVKLGAMTVNGTSPFTAWITATTFRSDLDESIVPDQPSSLSAEARDDEISISWTPPKESGGGGGDNKILVRGYTIGWGKGIPDEYTKVVDEKQRSFVIKNLKPNSEYVISLRAYNNVGDGRPIYETVRTREEFEEEPTTPLIPPVGLHPIVLSSSTVVLTWVDSSLPRNQVVSDNRFYIVRYTSVANKPRKHQYRNSTDLNVMIDDLRPDTEYEFTVKIVKGRRQSPWSLVALNKTQEAEPSSSPRDLLIEEATDGGEEGSVTLSWRPPKFPNGKINGYIIQYTTNRRSEEREWYVEAVVGDQVEARIDNLLPDTKYYFKMSARNNKGYGPSGPIYTFKTPKAYATRGGLYKKAGGGSSSSSDISPMILYAVFGVGAGIVIVLIIGIVLFIRSRISASHHPTPIIDRHHKNYLQGSAAAAANDPSSSSSSSAHLREKLNPPPPDLWIGHDQLELKAMDGDETGETTLPRSTPDYRSASSMDRSRYNNNTPYSGTESEISYSLVNGNNGGRRSLTTGCRSSVDRCALLGGPSSSKPVKIAAINGKPRVQRYLSKESVASSVPTNGSSTYIRSQYNLNPPRAESPEDLPPPGYDPSAASDGPPSTIGGDVGWGGVGVGVGGGGANTTASSIDGGSSQLGALNAVAPPQLPPTYLSSAMSTSSENSSSASGSGSRNSRQQLKSFRVPTPPLNSTSQSQQQQPKNIVRPQQQQQQQHPPSSPFKRPLLSSLSKGPSIINPQFRSSAPTTTTQPQPQPQLPPPPPTKEFECFQTGNLPSIAAVRSPDVLHPKDGPCDCLSHPIPHSLSTEELNADLKNLEGLMKDLSSMSPTNQYNC